MLAEYKSKTNLGVGVGIVLQIFGRILASGGGASGALGLIVTLVGLGALIWGCMNYVQGKGYHAVWGLLGLLSIIGLLVLVAMRDKHKEA